MRRLATARLAGPLAAVGAAGLVAYLLGVRPRHLRWGATDAEIARPMPGDDLVAAPTYVTNRAVTIWARPAAIWTWLVQMGELPRGGFYSYEWIERLLGMRVENAERTLSQFQHLEVGDALDRSGNLVVKAVMPDKGLVLGPPESLGWGQSTWAIGLYPLDEERTRLVSRVRARFDRWTPRTLFWLVLLDPGQFVMERKWLLSVKERAEATAGHGEHARGAPPLPVPG
jgi:hypothetical protein